MEKTPVSLPLLDQRPEALVVAAALRAHLLVLLRAQMVHRPEEDHRVVEVVDGRDDDVRGRRPQPLLDRRVGVRERVEPLLLEAQHPRVHLVQQVVLGAEVVVERALGDAGRLDDLLHGGAVVAALGEEPGGGGQQPLRDGRTVSVRRPGHCRHLPSEVLLSPTGRPPGRRSVPDRPVSGAPAGGSIRTLRRPSAGQGGQPVVSHFCWMWFMFVSQRSGSAARAW